MKRHAFISRAPGGARRLEPIVLGLEWSDWGVRLPPRLYAGVNAWCTGAWVSGRRPPMKLDLASDINRNYALAMNYSSVDLFMIKILWWHFGFTVLMALYQLVPSG
jgi:hypothetical protein